MIEKYLFLLLTFLRKQRKPVSVENTPAEIEITVGKVTGEYGAPDDE